MKNNTNHEWCDKLIELLSKTNKDRNQLLKDDKDNFEKEIIKCHIMVGKNTLKSLVLLLQADLILIIPEKHFHILSLQI